MLPELFLKKLQQPATVPRLLLPHAFEHGGGSGIILPQPFGKIGINAFVFFFQGDGQGQYFPFREFFELFHAAID